MVGDDVAQDVPACKMRSTRGWPAWPLRTAVGATREYRTRRLIWAARSGGAPSPTFLRRSTDFFLTHSTRTQRDEHIPSDSEIRMSRHSTVCRRPAGRARFPKCRWEGFLSNLSTAHRGVAPRGDGDQEKQKRSLKETHVPNSMSLLDHIGGQYSKSVQ